MKQQTKKILSLCLCLVFVLSLLPARGVTAHAQDYASSVSIRALQVGDLLSAGTVLSSDAAGDSVVLAAGRYALNGVTVTE